MVPLCIHTNPASASRLLPAAGTFLAAAMQHKHNNNYRFTATIQVNLHWLAAPVKNFRMLLEQVLLPTCLWMDRVEFNAALHTI